MRVAQDELKEDFDVDVRVLSNRALRGHDAGIRILQDGKVVETLPAHEFEGELTAHPLRDCCSGSIAATRRSAAA